MSPRHTLAQISDPLRRNEQPLLRCYCVRVPSLPSRLSRARGQFDGDLKYRQCMLDSPPFDDTPSTSTPSYGISQKALSSSSILTPIFLYFKPDPDSEPTGPVLCQGLENISQRVTLAHAERVCKDPRACLARSLTLRGVLRRQSARIQLSSCHRSYVSALSNSIVPFERSPMRGRCCEATQRLEIGPTRPSRPLLSDAASPPPITRSATSRTSTSSCTFAAPINRSSRALAYPGVVPDHAHRHDPPLPARALLPVACPHHHRHVTRARPRVFVAGTPYA